MKCETLQYSVGRFLLLIAALTLAVVLSSARAQHDDFDHVEVEGYPSVQGGEWVRGLNIVGPDGEPYPRQEHAVPVLNGFIYLINGISPVEEPPEPTEDEPDPDPVDWLNDLTVFVPAGHPYHQENGTENGNGEGAWLHLDEDSRHPTEYHHLIFTVHEDRIWTFGGHEEEFSPTDPVYVFTPDSPDAPEGSWSASACRTANPATCPRPARP